MRSIDFKTQSLPDTLNGIIINQGAQFHPFESFLMTPMHYLYDERSVNSVPLGLGTERLDQAEIRLEFFGVPLIAKVFLFRVRKAPVAHGEIVGAAVVVDGEEIASAVSFHGLFDGA